MHAGQLKDLVYIYEEKEAEPNEFAERVKSYRRAFPVRAEVSYQGGAEKMYGQMSAAERTLKFRVRFSMSRYNERQLVRYRGEYYNVRSIDPDRNRSYLILQGERVPEGTVEIEE